jgi:hypothetical protein
MSPVSALPIERCAPNEPLLEDTKHHACRRGPSGDGRTHRSLLRNRPDKHRRIAPPRGWLGVVQPGRHSRGRGPTGRDRGGVRRNLGVGGRSSAGVAAWLRVRLAPLAAWSLGRAPPYLPPGCRRRRNRLPWVSSAQAGFVPTLLLGQFMIRFSEETASRRILLYGLERLRSRRFALILSSFSSASPVWWVSRSAGRSRSPCTESWRLRSWVSCSASSVCAPSPSGSQSPSTAFGTSFFRGNQQIPKSELGPLAALPVLAVLSVPLIAGLLRLLEQVGRHRELVGPGGRPSIVVLSPSCWSTVRRTGRYERCSSGCCGRPTGS